jgi:hypothetical protein
MDKLDFTWLVSALSGLKTIRIVLQRKSFRESKLKDYKAEIRHFFVPVFGALMHLMLMAIFLSVDIQILLWWIISSYFLAPFLGILRNVLEHRYLEKVDSRIWDEVMGKEVVSDDYSRVTTRIFTVSSLSQLWGSMGFTRHLIHHWDPSISYIHLKKVHMFLLDTKIGPLLKSQDTTFLRTFKELWQMDYAKAN